MKFAIVLAAVLAVSAAQYKRAPISQPRLSRAPVSASSDQAANIVRYENDIGPDGSYSYAFETDNGIAAQAKGTPRDLGGNPPVVPIVSQGSFSWVAPGGEPVSITYVADENGYQPEGAALPTPPAIPPQILRALEYIAKNPQKN